MKGKLPVWAEKAAAVLVWLLVWQLAAVLIAKPLLLPSPAATALTLLRLASGPGFWQTIGMSMLRVSAGILCAVVLGLVCAVLCCRSALLRLLFSPLLTVIKSAPVASFTILLLVWLRRDIVPSVISALIVLPVVWSNVSTGIRQTDVQLLEMARVFRFSRLKVLRRIYVPSVKPYFVSACRSAIGFGWKAGIAAEVLTVPALSIGKMIFESKQYLMTEELFAWTAATVILSVIIEKLALGLMGGGKNDKS